MAPETLTLDLGEDRAAAVADEPQSGLGKGLAADLAAPTFADRKSVV